MFYSMEACRSAVALAGILCTATPATSTMGPKCSPKGVGNLGNYAVSKKPMLEKLSKKENENVGYIVDCYQEHRTNYCTRNS